MRLLYTIKNDMWYQAKYGFYFIYTILTIVYILILRPITDPTIKSLTGSLIMLSDPAVLGYFFIGGIWLLEKDEDLHNYIRITPLKTMEYVLSKIFSLLVSDDYWCRLLAFTAPVFISRDRFSFLMLLYVDWIDFCNLR